MSHTKAIATQQTHPFHQGRNYSVLATASMISLAKILGICCSLGGKIETVPQIISRRTFPSDWVDGNGKDNLSPHSSFHKRVVGQRLVWWEQRCVLMSTSPGRPHLESLKIWRMVEILSSQGSSLANRQLQTYTNYKFSSISDLVHRWIQDSNIIWSGHSFFSSN